MSREGELQGIKRDIRSYFISFFLVPMVMILVTFRVETRQESAF